MTSVTYTALVLKIELDKTRSLSRWDLSYQSSLE